MWYWTNEKIKQINGKAHFYLSKPTNRRLNYPELSLKGQHHSRPVCLFRIGVAILLKVKARDEEKAWLLYRKVEI